jgi:hypothetical protein
MRRAMASTLWRFSTTRMLHDYVEKMYLPAAAAGMAGDATTMSDAAAAGAEPARAAGALRGRRTAATG